MDLTDEQIRERLAELVADGSVVCIEDPFDPTESLYYTPDTRKEVLRAPRRTHRTHP